MSWGAEPRRPLSSQRSVTERKVRHSALNAIPLQ